MSLQLTTQLNSDLSKDSSKAIWYFVLFNNFLCFKKFNISMSHDFVDFLCFFNYWASLTVCSVNTITILTFLILAPCYVSLPFLCTKCSVANFPTFEILSYSCNKSRNFNFHSAKLYIRRQYLDSLDSFHTHLSPSISSSFSLTLILSLTATKTCKGIGYLLQVPELSCSIKFSNSTSSGTSLKLPFQ